MMKACILLLILPALSFAQNKRTVFVESGVSVFTPFTKQKQDAAVGYYDFALPTSEYDFKYTYKNKAGYYLKAGLEINSNTTKRFTVIVPVSIGYKEINGETIREGYGRAYLWNFNGIESVETNQRYASLMAGPKFNFKVKRFAIYTALNVNMDLFLSGHTKITYNNNSARKHSVTEIKDLRSDDISANSGLQIGADYRITEYFQIGLSAEMYFARLNSMMSKSSLFFYNFSGDKDRSAIFFCGAKLGYAF